MNKTMDIKKGERFPLTKLCSNAVFQIGMAVSGTKNTIDFSCFGLDSEKKLSNDQYMTFFNQPKTPCGAIELSSPEGDSGGFLCDLNKLPLSIDRVVFTAAIDGNETMNDIRSGYLRFLVSGKEVSKFSFSGIDFQQEKALMLGELYRKDGSWRFCAIGQGFNGGLASLVKHFGGEVKDIKETPLVSKISLSKITLEKRGDKISLEKHLNSNGYGRIRCNLNWTSGATNKKSFQGIDLDLGCLYELSDGTKSTVQALGKSFGSYEKKPFIQLAGDDRSGESKDGEFLYINGDTFNSIKRVLIYTFIYEGTANWVDASAKVTITIPNQPVIEVFLDGTGSNQKMCAIAMLENINGELKLTKLDEYFAGHREIDSHYNWGLSWKSGSK